MVLLLCVGWVLDVCVAVEFDDLVGVGGHVWVLCFVEDECVLFVDPYFVLVLWCGDEWVVFLESVDVFGGGEDG